MSNIEAGKLVKSPVGAIKFSSLTTARVSKFTGKSEYSMRLEVDGDDPGAAAFLKDIRTINKKLGNKEDTEKEGNYFLNGKSKNKPKVYDKEMNLLAEEEIPAIESGTARLILTPFINKKDASKSGLEMVGVQLLDIVEYVGDGQEFDDDAIKAVLAS